MVSTLCPAADAAITESSRAGRPVDMYSYFAIMMVRVEYHMIARY